MNSDARLRNTSRLLIILVTLTILTAGVVRGAGTNGRMAETQNASTEILGRIARANEPVVILGSVVAISDETAIQTEGQYGASDIMLLKVEKVLGGRNPGQYVRADFNHYSPTIDPKKGSAQLQIRISLRAGKKIKIDLRPPISGAECRWPIPAPPKPGEEIGLKQPVMLPVGGAKGYPDINTLVCFGFDLNDIEESVSPGKAK